MPRVRGADRANASTCCQVGGCDNQLPMRVHSCRAARNGLPLRSTRACGNDRDRCSASRDTSGTSDASIKMEPSRHTPPSACADSRIRRTGSVVPANGTRHLALSSTREPWARHASNA